MDKQKLSRKTKFNICKTCKVVFRSHVKYLKHSCKIVSPDSFTERSAASASKQTSSNVKNKIKQHGSSFKHLEESKPETPNRRIKKTDEGGTCKQSTSEVTEQEKSPKGGPKDGPVKNVKLALSASNLQSIVSQDGGQNQAHFKCATCRVTYISYELCASHVLEKHKNFTIKHRFKPDGTNYNNNKQKMENVTQHIPPSTASQASTPIAMCNYCNMFFLSSEACFSHAKDVHKVQTFSTSVMTVYRNSKASHLVSRNETSKDGSSTSGGKRTPKDRSATSTLGEKSQGKTNGSLGGRKSHKDTSMISTEVSESHEETSGSSSGSVGGVETHKNTSMTSVGGIESYKKQNRSSGGNESHGETSGSLGGSTTLAGGNESLEPSGSSGGKGASKDTNASSAPFKEVSAQAHNDSTNYSGVPHRSVVENSKETDDVENESFPEPMDTEEDDSIMDETVTPVLSDGNLGESKAVECSSHIQKSHGGAKENSAASASRDMALCHLCNTHFPSSAECLRHLQEKHLMSLHLSKESTQSVGPAKVKDKLLTQSMPIMYVKHTDLSSTKKATCHLCNTAFPSEESCMRHISAVHKINVELSTNSKQSAKTSEVGKCGKSESAASSSAPSKPTESIIVCPVCLLVCASLEDCHNHIKSIHGTEKMDGSRSHNGRGGKSQSLEGQMVEKYSMGAKIPLSLIRTLRYKQQLAHTRKRKEALPVNRQNKRFVLTVKQQAKFSTESSKARRLPGLGSAGSNPNGAKRHNKVKSKTNLGATSSKGRLMPDLGRAGINSNGAKRNNQVKCKTKLGETGSKSCKNLKKRPVKDGISPVGKDVMECYLCGKVFRDVASYSAHICKCTGKLKVRIIN